MKVALVLPGAGARRATEQALKAAGHEAMWCVSSGADAVRRAASETPDLLLVSVSLPDMSAAELTRRVLAKGCPAVLLVADGPGHNLSQVYEAMGAGALDVITAPASNSAGTLAGTEPLHAKLRTVGRLLGSASAKFPAAEAVPLLDGGVARVPPLIAIGASTGGPQALLTILKAFPKNFRAAIVIVQHVDVEFSQGLASWLEESSGIRVELARAGAAPQMGRALLAGSNDHLAMTASGSFRYTAEPRELPYRPSVDVLFSSLAQFWQKPCAAALLTGMGRDGAEGLSKLRKAGWHTLAQDEASCVVYGMPKAAALLGAACKILSPEGIAKELSDFIEKRPRTLA